MSIFGQVWLWSLLAFVAGVLITWLTLVRPVRKQVADLEDQLLEARSVPLPPPPSKVVEDDFVVDEWEVAPSLADEVLLSSPRVDELSDERPRSLHERLAPEEPRVAPPYAPTAEVVHVDHEPMAPAEVQVDPPVDDFIYQPREVWSDQETFLDEAAEVEDDDVPDSYATPAEEAEGQWPSTDLTGEYAGLQDQIANRLSGGAPADETTYMEPVTAPEDDEQARLDAFHAQADAESASERTTIHEPIDVDAFEQERADVAEADDTASEQTLIQRPVERGDETAAEQTLIQAPIDPDAYEQQSGWRPGAAYRPDTGHAAHQPVEELDEVDQIPVAHQQADVDPAVAGEADFQDEAFEEQVFEDRAEVERSDADPYDQLVESAQAAAPEQGFTAPADEPDQTPAPAALTGHQQVPADFAEPEVEPEQAPAFAEPQPAFAEPQPAFDEQPEAQEPEEEQAFSAFSKPSADGHVSYEPFATPGAPAAAASAFDPFAAVTPVDPEAEAFAPLNGTKPDIPEPPVVVPPVVERPRSLFEPILEADDSAPLTETKRPEPPASQDQPFVPKFVPGPPLSEQADIAPPAPETDLPHVEEEAALPQRETAAGLPRREARRSTPPRPFQAPSAPPPPQPAAPPPSQVRPPRPRPVGFSPSTGGRSQGGATTRYQQPEGFNPRSPFGPGSVLPKSDGLAPANDFAVKATLTGRRYFTPESANFNETRADVWFRTIADAQKAGFRPAP